MGREIISGLVYLTFLRDVVSKLNVFDILMAELTAHDDFGAKDTAGRGEGDDAVDR